MVIIVSSNFNSYSRRGGRLLVLFTFVVTITFVAVNLGGEKGGRKMQLHFSPSMRSITISNGNGGGGDLMKLKFAPRHIPFRAVFHAILILAFLLPFVFILTAVITLEGINKCSTLG